MSATDPKVRKFATCAENAAERGLRWCRERDEAVAERDNLLREVERLRDRIERALGALCDKKLTGWEARQAVGLILTDGQDARP